MIIDQIQKEFRLVSDISVEKKWVKTIVFSQINLK